LLQKNTACADMNSGTSWMHCGVSFCGSFTAELTGNRFNIPASNRINRRLKRPQSEAGAVSHS